MPTITVNGARRDMQLPPDTALFYVLRNDLELASRLVTRARPRRLRDAVMPEKYTNAAAPGIVIHPLQLKRQVEGGAVIAAALHHATGRIARRLPLRPDYVRALLNA